MIPAKPVPPPFQPNGALGPAWSGVVARAALGDLDCLRAIYRDRCAALFGPRNVDSAFNAIEAVSFGRLLISRGDPDDARSFAGVLLAAAGVFREIGRPDLVSHFGAEAVALLEQLAEHGDDIAALSSQILIEDGAVDLADRVRALRRKATQAEEPA